MSNLFDGMQQRRIVAVYIPIVRDGIVRYVLSAALPASRFGEVLRAQQFGPSSVAVLQDRDNVIVARTQAEAEMVGDPMSGRIFDVEPEPEAQPAAAKPKRSARTRATAKKKTTRRAKNAAAWDSSRGYR